MEKIFLKDGVDFYINHVCNLNCPECSSFNNYNFKGMDQWKDWKECYTEWSKKKMEFRSYRILGGEPLANPSILEWIKGLRELWPNTSAMLFTNGTLIKSTDTKLYNTLIETNTKIVISLHNRSDKQKLLDTLKDWLIDPVIEHNLPSIDPKDANYNPDTSKTVREYWHSLYNNLRGEDWPDPVAVEKIKTLPDWVLTEIEDYTSTTIEMLFYKIIEKDSTITITDKNNINILIRFDFVFVKTAPQYNRDTKSFHLYQSNPHKAHEVCAFKTCKIFFKGELYKCSSVPLFPDFTEQFRTTLTNEQTDLIKSIKGITHDMSHEQIEKLLDSYENPIPQCSLCPQNMVYTEEFSATPGNKPKVSKNKKTVKY